jgi:hypothetical protein
MDVDGEHLAFTWGHRYHRELPDVERDRDAAAHAVDLVGEALAIAQHLPLGRETGGRLLRRLEVSRIALRRLAERDAEVAAELKHRDADPDTWEQDRQRGTLLAKRSRL